MMICSQAMATSTAWPLQRLGHVGHRAGPVEFVAGEEAGQLVGVFELGALAGVGGPFRHDEFEHEDGPLIVGGARVRSIDCFTRSTTLLSIGRRNADPLALPAGAVFLALGGPFGRGLPGPLLRFLLLGFLLLRLLLLWLLLRFLLLGGCGGKRQNPAASTSRRKPSRRGTYCRRAMSHRYRS